MIDVRLVLSGIVQEPARTLALFRAFRKMVTAENVHDFRAGLIQFVHALEKCYNETELLS